MSIEKPSLLMTIPTSSPKKPGQRYSSPPNASQVSNVVNATPTTDHQADGKKLIRVIAVLPLPLRRLDARRSDSRAFRWSSLPVPTDVAALQER